MVFTAFSFGNMASMAGARTSSTRRRAERFELSHLGRVPAELRNCFLRLLQHAFTLSPLLDRKTELVRARDHEIGGKRRLWRGREAPPNRRPLRMIVRKQ